MDYNEKMRLIFGQNLVKLEEENNARSRDVPRLAGVNERAYYKYREGAMYPNIESLTKIARLFEVSIDYLFNRTSNSDIISAKDEYDLNQLPIKVKILREELNISKSEIGKLCDNVSHPTLSKIESGNYKISIPTLLDLSDFFDVSIDYLLGKTDNKEINM